MAKSPLSKRSNTPRNTNATPKPARPTPISATKNNYSIHTCIMEICMRTIDLYMTWHLLTLCITYLEHF